MLKQDASSACHKWRVIFSRVTRRKLIWKKDGSWTDETLWDSQEFKSRALGVLYQRDRKEQISGGVYRIGGEISWIGFPLQIGRHPIFRQAGHRQLVSLGLLLQIKLVRIILSGTILPQHLQFKLQVAEVK